MNKLSVIIAFLNEGIEVEITIAEIKRTSGSAVDIILINDASNDGINYKEIATKYKITYIENERRLGCASSREIGVKACKTPYFLIIDAHMRFYKNDWWRKIVRAIKSDERAIYCCRCKVWDYETKTEQNTPAPYAAYIKFNPLKATNILDIDWVIHNIYPNEDIVDVPCILGACYAANKTYWEYLRGGEGLQLYSGDEQYISIKTWMEGGRCRLINNVTIGHLFRKKFPYTITKTEFNYNKIIIAETLLPKKIRNRIIKIINYFFFVDYININDLMIEDQNNIKELRSYYKTTLKEGFERFNNVNNKTIKALKKISKIQKKVIYKHTYLR